MLSGYARVYNNNYVQTGSVFRQKTKAKCVSAIEIKEGRKEKIEDYYEACFNYIHQNPVKAGLISKLPDWEFSSYLGYAGLRNGTLFNKKIAADYCAYDAGKFAEITARGLDEYIVSKIIE